MVARIQLDADKNGTIEFEEFLSFMDSQGAEGEQTHEMPDSELLAAFQIFDDDGNGFISVSELKAALTKISGDVTDEEVKEIIAVSDTDGNGQV